MSRAAGKSTDRSLVTGAGCFVADLQPSDRLHAVFVRSDFAHARISSIDTSVATDLPGVAMVVTAEDLSDLKPLRPVFLTHGDGWIADIERPILCSDRVRHVGDPVAMVVADTLERAVEASETVEIDYEPLEATTNLQRNDNPQHDIHSRAPGNVAMEWASGDKDAVERAFAKAETVVETTVRQDRVAPASLEPRGIVAMPDAATGKLTLEVPSQGAAMMQKELARVLDIGLDQLRVVTRDVGGSFGMKAGAYAEYPAVAFAAQVLNRPVSWVSTRSEAMQSDSQGRAMVSRGRLALDADGRFLGLRVSHEVDFGAYVGFAAAHATTGGLGMARTGLYDIRASTVEVTGFVTNAPWIDAYRGAGKPESILLLESLVDKAARVIGMDRAEIRRRNLIPPSAMPYQTSADETYFNGDFPNCLELALKGSNWADRENKAQEAAARGKLFGVGISCWLDLTSSGPEDTARLILHRDGLYRLTVGSQDTGQGHAASFSAAISRKLGVEVALTDLSQGDTDLQPDGGGTFGAKTMAVAGDAAVRAAADLIQSARQRVSTNLGCELDDVEYEAGLLSVPGTNFRFSLGELASDEPLVGTGSGGGTTTCPNGCHVCEVEIDADTCVVQIVNYVAADDYGQILDRAGLEGQVLGGIAQGLGQVLSESVAFNQDDGQLLTGSLMDYALPRASSFSQPQLTFLTDFPDDRTDIGSKGSGQAGTIAALAAGLNAINDALARAGAPPVDLAATPQRIWDALQAR